jgi:predicted GNAT family acetyltransferase
MSSLVDAFIIECMDTSNHPQSTNFYHLSDKSQFTLDWNGHTAWVDYEIMNNTWYLLHAEVPAALRGQGVGQVLVEKAYAYLNEHGIKSVPVCSYIQALVKRNPCLVTGATV